MKPNEFRIGNWVMSAKGEIPFQWQASDFEEIYNTMASPIPLTPEILEKFDNVGKTKSGKDFKLHDLMIMYKEDNGTIALSHGYFMNEKPLKDINLKCSVIKYVHQYQNLFFDLTGQETEINLNEKVLP